MNNSMGTSCSVHRSSSNSSGGNNKSTRGKDASGSFSSSLGSISNSNCATSSLRYSVVSELSDHDVAQLYNNNNKCNNNNNNCNYTSSTTLVQHYGAVKNIDDGTFSPKSLAELATMAVCKSLVTKTVNVDCTCPVVLPPGLPPDVVQDILAFLYHYYALNSTTLRAVLLNNSDVVQNLTLSRCRGVNDSWFNGYNSDQTQQHDTAVSPAVEKQCQFLDIMSPTSSSNSSFDTAFMNESSLGNDIGAAITSAIFDVEMKDVATNVRKESISSIDTTATTATYVDTPLSSPTLAIKTIVRPNASLNNTSIINTAFCTTSNTEAGSVCNFSDIIMSSTGATSLRSFSSASSSLSTYSAFQLGSCLTTLDLRGCHDISDYGLLQLGDLTYLEHAYFDHCHAICGSGLRVLSNSQQLRTLSLAHCRRLTDEALYNLQNLDSNNLLEISLEGCRCITDNGMWAIKDHCGMQDLNLGCCELITNKGLQYLQKLENLKHVSLSWCKRVTDTGLIAFASQPGRVDNLQRLEMIKSSISDKGILSMLPLLQALEVLNLSNCPKLISGNLFNAIKQLPKLHTLELLYCPGILKEPNRDALKTLKVLNLAFTGTKDAQIMSLPSLPNLESLNLESCLVTDRSMQHLADNNVVPNLRHLDLADTDVGDAGLVHIAKMQNLTNLSLFYCQVTNEGMKSVALLSNLEKLNIDSRDISDEGLRNLRNCRNLKYLDLFSGRISDIGCRHLAKLKNLEHLELCGGIVGDLGCTHLMRLKKLQTLNLAQNERITNRGAASLASIYSLKNLNLSFTGVKGRACSKSFHELPNLESLALCGCVGVVEKEGGEHLDNLKNAVPSLRYLRLHNAAEDEGLMNNKEIIHHHDSCAMSSFLTERSMLSAMSGGSGESTTKQRSTGGSSSSLEEDNSEEEVYSDYD